MDTIGTQKLRDLITFAGQYVEEDRFAETLGRILVSPDIETSRSTILLLALAIVHADQSVDEGDLEDVYSELAIALPYEVRQRFMEAVERAHNLDKAVRGMA